MKWLWLLLLDPVAALDLTGPDGRISHGKVIGLFTFLSLLSTLFLYVVNAGQLLPLGHTIALISTAYGWAGWRAFLASKAATATETREERRETITMVERPDGDAETMVER